MDKSDHIESEELLAEESLRIQKAEWVKQQAEKQRAIEDAAWERLLQEQEILNERNRSIEEDMERTRQMQRYHADCLEDLNTQVFALHGLTADKLQGMKEYKNARYQGVAAAVFIISAAFAVLCGWLYGFTSRICLFMIACLGIEGALLSQEGRRGRLLDRICRFLYLFPLPGMAAVFVCYEFEIPECEFVMTVCALAGVVLLGIGTVSYFVYNPYRGDKKKVREAKDDLREIQQIAKQAVRKNQKAKKKEEARAARRQKNEEKKLAVRQRREEKRLASGQKWKAVKEDLNNRIDHVKKQIGRRREVLPEDMPEDIPEAVAAIEAIEEKETVTDDRGVELINEMEKEQAK